MKIMENYELYCKKERGFMTAKVKVMDTMLHIGIDIGSTTVKIAVLNEKNNVCMLVMSAIIRIFAKKYGTYYKMLLKFSATDKLRSL